jgi:hypothetical protein
MEENELERFFELEPVPSPSCAGHGRPRLFEGEMESRFDPDVPLSKSMYSCRIRPCPSRSPSRA